MKADAQAQTQAREANSRVTTIDEFLGVRSDAVDQAATVLTFFEIWNSRLVVRLVVVDWWDR
jgi:hypothetical protein